METDAEFERWRARITEGLVVAQSLAFANQFVLMEVVRLLARWTSDPNQTLSTMFENISSRMDQAPIADESEPAYAGARTAIADLFAQAGKGLEARDR